MDWYLVEFAVNRDDEPKVYLLDEHKYDHWHMCEPQEGYHLFRTIWCGPIQQIVIHQGTDLDNGFVYRTKW